MTMPIKTRRSSNIIYVALSVFIVGIMLTVVNIYELKTLKQSQPEEVTGLGTDTTNRKPKVWIRGENQQTGYLQHITSVFKKLGYLVVTDGEDENWSVLWSHEYPFGVDIPGMYHLKPHQRVNHFPGSGFITMKVNLATSKYEFVPVAFQLPDEKLKFLEYVKQHTETMWVQKSNNHRHIKIIPVKDLELDKKDTFLQEYIQHPLLIDDRKFDIGIYTVITSINPLRVYVVGEEALFRFCPHPYYPFDPTDLDKYVIGDDYTPLWEMPSLKTAYTTMSYNFKQSFNIYMESKGYDYKMLWCKLHDAVAEVCRDKEEKLIKTASRYHSYRNFFELVRFDFVVDKSLNVYLMEVNMSPNLSSGHFPPNKRLYEHIIYNALSLVGVGTRVLNPFLSSNDDEMSMQVSDADIQTSPAVCLKNCHDSCSLPECKLCHRCMTMDIRLSFKLAYLEHHNQGSFHRVYPPHLNQTEAREWKVHGRNLNKTNELNHLMTMWFVSKCLDDVKWCS